MCKMGVSGNTYQLSNMILWLGMKGIRLEETQKSVVISTSSLEEAFISGNGNRESESCTTEQCLHWLENCKVC